MERLKSASGEIESAHSSEALGATVLNNMDLVPRIARKGEIQWIAKFNRDSDEAMYQGCKMTDTNVLFNISIVNIGKTRAEALVEMPNSQQMSNLGGTVSPVALL